jgi:hypothetical protein
MNIELIYVLIAIAVGFGATVHPFAQHIPPQQRPACSLEVEVV